MTSSCQPSGSYIYCLKHFEDLLFFCQQSPCHEHAQNLCDCLQSQLSQQFAKQSTPALEKLVSNKSTQISKDFLFPTKQSPLSTPRPNRLEYNQQRFLEENIPLSITSQNRLEDQCKEYHSFEENTPLSIPNQNRSIEGNGKNGLEQGQNSFTEPEDVKVQPHDVHKMMLARINKELQDGDKDSPVRKPESHTPHSSLPWVVPKTTYNNSPQFSRTNPPISYHRQNIQNPKTSSPISSYKNPRHRRENTGEPEDVKVQPHDVHKMVLARINKELQDGDKDSPVRKPESHTPHSSSPWVNPKTLNNSHQFSRTNPLISHHRHRKNFQSPITSRSISLSQNPRYRTENTGGTVQSILRDPPRTKCSKKKYNGFYADYCRSLCICDPCCPWHQPYSLLNSIFDTKNCCPEIETCPSRCPKKEEDKKESGIINCVKHVGRQLLRETNCCQEERYDAGVIHVLEPTPTLENENSVAVTSTIMMLFFVMAAFYTFGLNIGEYFTFKAGLHGRTFYLIPYMLRSITIGFVFMSYFLGFLLCPNSMKSFVDLVLRTFVFSFLASAIWNIVEYTMETRQTEPLLYFGASGLLCLLAMLNFYRFVNRNIYS